MGQRGERGVIMEENGVLRESETPSGGPLRLQGQLVMVDLQN